MIKSLLGAAAILAAFAICGIDARAEKIKTLDQAASFLIMPIPIVVATSIKSKDLEMAIRHAFRKDDFEVKPPTAMGKIESDKVLSDVFGIDVSELPKY